MTIETPELHDRLGYLIKRVELGLRIREDDHLRNIGVTTNQFAALMVLSRVDGLSTAELARYFRVSPQAMAQLVAGLERRELVRRRADPHHQKIMRVSLTDDGREAARQGNEMVLRTEAELMDQLPAAQRQTLLTALRTCCELLGVLDSPTPRRHDAQEFSDEAVAGDESPEKPVTRTL